MKSKTFIGCLCALSCEVLFGLSYVFTKKVTGTAGEFELLGWRFFTAFLVMTILVITGSVKINLKGKKIKSLLLVALFSPVIYFIGETVGIANTSASESGVFLACIPVVSLVASSMILKKKPTKWQSVGIAITLIGVLVTVFAAGASANLSVTGYIFLTIAVISYALYSVFVEKTSEFTEAEITYVQLCAGALVFVVTALIKGFANGTAYELIALPFGNPHFLIAILYQGIGCSILAFFMSNAAITRIGVNRTSSFIGASTVVSILAGMLILGEPFSLMRFVGAIIIIAGIYTANIGK